MSAEASDWRRKKPASQSRSALLLHPGGTSGGGVAGTYRASARERERGKDRGGSVYSRQLTENSCIRFSLGEIKLYGLYERKLKDSVTAADA